MTGQPVQLHFELKFNLYRLAGLNIHDNDIPAIARLYGVSGAEIEAIAARFTTSVDRQAALLYELIPPCKPTAPYRIVTAGDSLTADRESYANILNAYWRDTGRTIINAGRSSDTTQDLAARLDRDVLTHDASHVILFIGTNDIGDPRVSFDDFTDTMEYLLNRLHDAGKTIVQVTLPPADNDHICRFFGDTGWGIDPSRLAAANEFIRNQSRNRGTHLADLAAAIDETGIDPLLPDGLHLNGAGQLMLAELLARILP